MRTRKEIEQSGVKSGNIFYGTDRKELILEVLLDIRDLLAKAANPLYQIKDGGRIEIRDCDHD